MSKSSDADFDLELHFLPAWAQKAPEENRYAHYEGESEREGFDRRGRGRDRGPQRRPQGPGGREQRGGSPGAQRQGPPRGPGGPRRPHDQRRDQGGRRPEPRTEPPIPLPEINVAIVSEEKGVDLLARQIKMTGRAYPLFDIAQMILAKPERHSVTLSVKKNAEGQVIQPLFVCAVDETPWLTEDEAVQHLLQRHFNLFYQAERTQTEPPKGVYTFVAQCGLSGIILGPPNYHDYQNRLHKLHAERFSRMPFEVYKSRVKIVRDEAVVKKWIEDQSWRTEYVCLNLPEPLKLATREEVEKHFRATHLANVVKQAETVHLSGTASRNIPCRTLRNLVRQVWEDQRRFPLQVAVVLSQQFASRGLQFFKVNKTVTHVAVARPHYLDLEAVPVSEGVRQIVDYINAHPKCKRRTMIEALAPSPLPPSSAEVEPSGPPAAAVVPAPEAPLAQEAPVGEAPAAAPAPSPVPPAPSAEPEPTPEQTAVNADLHWLIHQGHVIEFANGTLETAKKPAPKPVKPAPARVPAPEGTAPAETGAAPVAGSENVEAAPAANAVPAESAQPTAPEAPVQEQASAAEGTPADAPSSEPPASEPAA